MALHVRNVAAERGDKACEVDAENIVFEDRGRILRFRPSKAPVNIVTAVKFYERTR